MKKSVLIIVSGVSLAIFCIVGTWLVVMYRIDSEKVSPREGREQIRIVAPDGQHAAFLWLPERTGMLVAQEDEVWIEAKIGSREKQRTLSATRTEGLSISWRNNSILEISYEKADIHVFRNWFLGRYGKSGPGRLDEIEVVLKKVDKTGTGAPTNKN